MKLAYFILTFCLLFLSNHLIGSNVETFLADNNINPLIQDSTNTQINKLDYNVSYAMGKRDAELKVDKSQMILVGMGSGLILSIPGALIATAVAQGSQSSTIPQGVDSQGYRNGYHAKSLQIKKTGTFLGGMMGSVIQFTILIEILHNQFKDWSNE